MISSVQNCNNTSQIAFCSKYMSKKDAMELYRKLSATNVKTVDIWPHRSPDDDAINSATVIYRLLEKLGKKVSICLHLDGTEGLLGFNWGRYNIKNNSHPADMAILVDCNELGRLSKTHENTFRKQVPKTVIGIDHHKADNAVEGKFYIDSSSRSCSELVYMFLKRIGAKLNKEDLKNLFCGIISDYQKSGYVKIESSLEGTLFIKMPALKEDKNADRILEEIKKTLSLKERKKIYKYLDILSNLNNKEKAFRTQLSSEVKLTSNKKLAYVIIAPQDKQWETIGMDNTRTSAILGELRRKLLDTNKDLQGAIIFYRTSSLPNSTYRMSITSRNGYADTLIKHIKSSINPDLIAGGHTDRAGGKIESLEASDVKKFVSDFLQAAEEN